MPKYQLYLILLQNQATFFFTARSLFGCRSGFGYHWETQFLWKRDQANGPESASDSQDSQPEIVYFIKGNCW